jgi:cysteine desulfurase
MNSPSVYLDNAGSTPMETEVIRVMQECMAELHGNPSAIHEAGRRARVRIEESRRIMARLLSVAPSEVFFCSGATEGISAILWGCVRDLGCRHIITSGLEHPAVLNTLESMAKYDHVRIHFTDVGANGHVDPDHLAFLLQQFQPALVCLMHANNEIGNLLPVNAVGELCKANGALLFSDTAQTIGKFRMDLSDLPLDFAVASAHKFHGPKGSGMMYIRGGLNPGALIRGGGQERNMRAGTENLYGIVGMAKALELSMSSLEQQMDYIRGLRARCMDRLLSLLPDIRFNGDVQGHSLYTILNLSLPEHVDAETLLPRLDMAGIYVSGGSACASGSLKASHVLSAMGADPKRPSVRISFSKYNTPEQIDILAGVLQSICA